MPFTIRAPTTADSQAVRSLVGEVLHKFGLSRTSHAELQDVEASYAARGGRFAVIVDASGATGPSGRTS